ncbi:MAG: hypothetical protein QNJ61_08130 [Desulfobacterales bacterium]|nr:hypothetical protein [Desulfobacterales bacterium]
MNKIISLTMIALILIFMEVVPAQAMSVETMVELKKAGLSDATIQMAAREKVIETVAFTAEELIQLKQAGFEERTIQVLIQERSFMRGPQKVVYGRDTRPLRLSSVNDIIALKDAGMSDDVIQAIVRVAGSRKDEDYYRSWEMLENMNLEVDVGR